MSYVKRSEFHTKTFCYGTLWLPRTRLIVFWGCAESYLEWDRLRESKVVTMKTSDQLLSKFYMFYFFSLEFK